MISSLVSNNVAGPGFAHRLFRLVSLLAATCALAASLRAQAPATPPADNTAPTDNANGRTRRGNQNGDTGGRGNFNPADMQARMLTALREQFAVTDDAEWNLISERVTAVFDLRRSMNAGGFGGRGGFAGGGNRPNRPGATVNPEQDALRAALTDNLPDAEIKARLEHLREVRKQNEAKLGKAQEELRAVLTLRQEAVAVMAGLLP